MGALRLWIASPLLLGWLATAALAAEAREPEAMGLSVRGGPEREALFYQSAGTSAFVAAPQSGADATSWEKFCKAVQNAGIACLALSASSGDDVVAGVEMLRTRGYTDFILIGASVGGTGVQQATHQIETGEVKGVVLLATAGGRELTDESMAKLFVLARHDFFVSRARPSFSAASEPKTLLELPGREHGQDVFDGPHGALALSAILEFTKGALRAD